jgi:histidinol-phosphate aminotransferase
MQEFNLNNIIRKNIQSLKPYSSARSEFEGTASVYLDANENSMGGESMPAYHRYPDPLQKALKARISELKHIPAANIFLGNGSDEPIDLLFRAACVPGKDNVIVCPPTYGMYEVSANINEAELKEVLLTPDYQLDVPGIMAAVDANTKMIFICSPNNPTGNLLQEQDIETILNQFPGLVVIDEAYSDFAGGFTWLKRLQDFPNIVVLQTLSKAWGLAALRLGIAYASVDLIQVLNKIKPPYNINLLSQQTALHILEEQERVNKWIDILISERRVLAEGLKAFAFVQTVYPSDANFVLVRVNNANDLYQYLLKRGIVIRNRTTMPGCDNCVRITVGTPAENGVLLQALNEYQSTNL